MYSKSQRIPGKVIENLSKKKIVAEADVLSNFDNIAGIFYAAFREGKNQAEAKEAVRQKVRK